jgi:hypothetical protein
MQHYYLATFRGPANQVVSWSIFRAENAETAFPQAKLIGIGVQRGTGKDVDRIEVEVLRPEWLEKLAGLVTPLYLHGKGGDQ